MSYDPGHKLAPQRVNVRGRDIEEGGSQMHDKSSRYAAYLHSDEWARKRDAAKRHAEGRCQVCNGTTKIAVHHRTYARVYREKPRDLTVLCSFCHALFHARMPNLTAAELRRAEAFADLEAMGRENA